MITQGCVESTARDAMFHDYYVVITKDCVATYNKDLYDASLKVMGSRFDVLSSEDVVDIWDRNARTSIAAQ